MRQITSILVLAGITVLLYGLYNCNCKKMSIERFQQPSNINNKTEQIKTQLSSITSISKKNKDLINETNKIRESLKKFVSL